MIRDFHSGETRSADERARDSAQHMSSLSGRLHTAKFLCRANSPAFCGVDTDSAEAQVASINKEINCDPFMDWHRAKTAEEHEGMKLLAKVEEQYRLQLDEQRRERAQEKEEQNRERAEEKREQQEERRQREAQRAEDLEWRTTVEAAATNRFRHQEFRYWIVAVIALAALVVSIIVAAYNYPN